MLWQAYACGYDLSRDNALMSGVRQKERFSLGALCPSEIIKGIPPQYHLPELRGRRGKLEVRGGVNYSILSYGMRVTGIGYRVRVFLSIPA